jgi:hypothetical protein
MALVVGAELATPKSVHNIDSRPGKRPKSVQSKDKVTFLLKIGLPRGAQGQLQIRCDRDGNIYTSIVSPVLKDRP